MSLVERILDAFSASDYAMRGLMRLMDIVATEDTPTAAVECCASPRMLINPTFVERWAETPEKLLVVVMHEMHHVLLGHTTRFPRATPVNNLVFDAVINAMLCRSCSQRAAMSFFTGFYRDDRFPECFLRPPQGWSPQSEVGIPPALCSKELESLQPAYRALYSETSIDYAALRHILNQKLKPEDVLQVRLIGDHDNNPPPAPELVFETVRWAAAGWPAPALKGCRSWTDLLKQADARVRRAPSNRAVLGGLLRQVAGPQYRSRGGPMTMGSVRVLTPAPSTDRRSVVLRAMGVPQALFPSEIHSRGGNSRERVHVYVDVSGSVINLIGALYGAVMDCAQLVYPKIHLFSTSVRDISWQQLRQGECYTTGGTSIDCVAQHMAANGVRRCVLLTDGVVGKPRGRELETLRNAITGVALTPNFSSKTDLQEVARCWAQLEREVNS